MNSLSDAEFTRQYAEVKRIRARQSRELIRSGIAARAIASSAISNTHSVHEPLVRRDLFYPHRSAFATMPDFLAEELAQDVGLSALSAGFVSRIEAASRMRDTPEQPTFTYILSRDRPVLFRVGYTSHRVGVDLSESVAAIAAGDDMPRLRPIEGILVSDLELIKQQLAEIEAARIEMGLTMIDPVTLLES